MLSRCRCSAASALASASASRGAAVLAPRFGAAAAAAARAFSSRSPAALRTHAPQSTPEDAGELLLDSVAEARFYSQHRPLAVQITHPVLPAHAQTSQLQLAAPADAAPAADSSAPTLPPHLIDLQKRTEANAEWYHDEYARIFGAFAPFVSPSETVPTPADALGSHADAAAAANVYSNDEQLLSDFFESFKSLGVAASPAGRRLRARKYHALARQSTVHVVPDAIEAPAHPAALVSEMQLMRRKFNIIKIRRKKMNKHKWKKYRRRVRNSSRYNKEKLRKGGIQRKKQD
ncbi:hypothetical protein HK105_207168 [Polyrhizophydium stewartii]|uniref:Mitochondrial mRNA-processing protein COX24 C-terminal domain-containing protein n=1 Tax=Polyrhizophydium stewartii TaxID=2732419 RepID=A0ABR4N188_9FUNG|nr:hypothetical protein HK105_007811 [Polyrhizophydium stewartii]